MQHIGGHCRGSFIIRKPENFLLPQWPRHVHTDRYSLCGVSAQKSLNYEKLILAKNTFSPCGRLAMSLPVLLLAVACWLLAWPTGLWEPFLCNWPTHRLWSVCTMIRRRTRTLATLYNLLWFLLLSRDFSKSPTAFHSPEMCVCVCFWGDTSFFLVCLFWLNFI